MACFIAPATEAIITTIAVKVVEKREKSSVDREHFETMTNLPFSRKLKWLRNMLWGGSALLCFEHIWHGEVVPWFPFLTAASTDVTAMMYEMATVGATMAGVVTAVWLGMVGISALIEKRTPKVALPEC